MRNGHSAGGKQRFVCRGCGRSSTQDARVPGVSPEREAQVLAALNERMSARGGAHLRDVAQHDFGPAPKKDRLMLEQEAQSGVDYLEATLLPA